MAHENTSIVNVNYILDNYREKFKIEFEVKYFLLQEDARVN